MRRALLIVLLLANVAVWAWRQPGVAHALGLPSPDSQREPERLSRQVNPQAVRVVPPAASGAMAAAAPASAPAAPTERVCRQTGPLAEDVLAQATRQLAGLGLKSDQWQDHPQDSAGRWAVVMGPYKSREAMLRKQEELRNLKIASDEIANRPRLNQALSLGQFNSPDEAQARQAQVARLGARTARVETLVAPKRLHLLRVETLTAAQAAQLSAAAADGTPGWQPCDEAP